MNCTCISPPSINTGNNPLIEFGILLVATLIGTGVGFGLVMWWDRRKKKETTNETINRIINAMLAELKQMKANYDLWPTKNQIKWIVSKRGFEGEIILQSFGTYDSAKHSGNLSLLPPDLQVDLDNVNNSILSSKQVVDQILTFNTSAVFPTIYADSVATHLIDTMNSEFKRVDDDMTPLIEKLGKFVNL